MNFNILNDCKKRSLLTPIPEQFEENASEPSENTLGPPPIIPKEQKSKTDSQKSGNSAKTGDSLEQPKVVRNEGSSEEEAFVHELQAKFPQIITESNRNEEIIKCDICLDLNSEDDDQMVICEVCLVAVHQSCYKKDLQNKVPEHEWLCMRCEQLKKQKKLKFDSIKCALCTDVRGVLVNVNFNQFQIEWVHPICINWNPYLNFENDCDKTTIVGDLQNYCLHALKEKNCMVCVDTKHKGFKYYCDIKECGNCFHIKCAANQRFIGAYDIMIGNNFRHRESPDYIGIFCSDHVEIGTKIMSSSDIALRKQSLRVKSLKFPFGNSDRCKRLLAQKLIPKKRGRKPKNYKKLLEQQQQTLLNYRNPEPQRVLRGKREGKRRGKKSKHLVHEEQQFEQQLQNQADQMPTDESLNGDSQKNDQVVEDNNGPRLYSQARSPINPQVVIDMAAINSISQNPNILQQPAMTSNLTQMPQLNIDPLQQVLNQQTLYQQMLYQQQNQQNLLMQQILPQTQQALLQQQALQQQKLQEQQQQLLQQNIRQQQQSLQTQEILQQQRTAASQPILSQCLDQVLEGVGFKFRGDEIVQVNNIIIALGIQKLIEIQGQNQVMDILKNEQQAEIQREIIAKQERPSSTNELRPSDIFRIHYNCKKPKQSKLPKSSRNKDEGAAEKGTEEATDSLEGSEEVKVKQEPLTQPQVSQDDAGRQQETYNTIDQKIKPKCIDKTNEKPSIRSILPVLNTIEQEQLLQRSSTISQKKTGNSQPVVSTYRKKISLRDPSESDTTEDQYKLDSDLFRLLRFMEELLDKDQKGTTRGLKSSRIFTDPKKFYSRADIEMRFKQLLHRLSLYDTQRDMYDLKGSQIIQKVFGTGQQFKDEQLWNRLLVNRCKKVIIIQQSMDESNGGDVKAAVD